MAKVTYEETIMCKVDVGCSLDELKEAMLEKKKIRNSIIYGIFNGQLYVAYEWAETIDDIDKY